MTGFAAVVVAPVAALPVVVAAVVDPAALLSSCRRPSSCWCAARCGRPSLRRGGGTGFRRRLRLRGTLLRRSRARIAARSTTRASRGASASLAASTAGSSTFAGRRTLAADRSKERFDLAPKRRVVGTFNGSSFNNRDINVTAINCNELERGLRLLRHQTSQNSHSPADDPANDEHQQQGNFQDAPRPSSPRQFDRSEIDLLGFGRHAWKPRAPEFLVELSSPTRRINYRQKRPNVNWPKSVTFNSASPLPEPTASSYLSVKPVTDGRQKSGSASTQTGFTPWQRRSANRRDRQASSDRQRRAARRPVA